jgi:ribose transport system ATP-binding protein
MKRLEIKNIVKTFPGVRALDNVSLDLHAGEVLGLLGENGAGKSTLAKILMGIYSPDSGELRVNGEPVAFGNPRDAKTCGITMIHQELSLMENMSVMENILLGSEPTTKLGTVDFSAEYVRAQEVLDLLGGGIDPAAKVGDLGVGAQQKVEIARALSQNSQVFLMDEATSSLSSQEIDRLFELIEDLKKNGASIIYITHRLDEVFRICDRMVVLRNGKLVGDVKPAEVEMNDVVAMIAGKTVKELSPHRFNPNTEPILAVKGLATKGQTGRKLEQIDFELRPGEILGVTGLLGAGKTELCRALWGIEPLESGEIYIDGARININSPQTAIKHGLACVPEDRHTHGIIPNMDVVRNITLPKLEDVCAMNHLVKQQQEVSIARHWIDKFRIAASSHRQLIKNLSGGNQQKVILSRWLQTEPRVLMIDEPTRGIDVGAKEEIRKLIQQFAEEGMAVIIFSCEVDEILALANNILVLYKGTIMDRYTCDEADKEKILASAMGVKQTRGVA